ncbi:MAG: CO dehydrogenase/CO-methylating acetyl-CoA synthase complex subunit beta [Candidatus Hydrogenedentes bacterium]|nr:CO dehydrogenase/CO-methylating acetyl-CoA synthase complex subunit beta [Candidatus Hydrogenedentota bacterium]
MSKAICADAITGAMEVVARADAMLARTIEAKGADHPVAFPNTAYYLPIIYSFTGRKVATVGDLAPVLEDCHRLLPEVPSEQVWLPYLGDALDAGVATLFAFEAIEACKTVIGPNPADGIWLGAANDVIMRERGVEFVDGTAPGFAAVIGAAPDSRTAVRIARELQEKNLYVFMAGAVDGETFAEQLHSEGVQLGWETRLVPFGRDVSAVVYALGFANRAALSFGGVVPGDFERNLRYTKNRIFAFVLALGEVDEEKYAAAAGAINYGFPTIADTDIPQILPTGVCTYEHVVSNVPHDAIVEKALEVRGCKVKMAKVPIPVPYGPAFEGERIRKKDVHVEFGGNLTPAFEYVTMVELDSISDGEIEIVGRDIDEVEPSSALPLGIWVEVAGRKMQPDFEPVLERQIHHLLNSAEGIWHMGQRDIIWTRVSKSGYDRGLRLRHYGEIIHAKFLNDYPAIVDKVKVTLITEQAEVERRLKHARKVYVERNHRVATLTDEAVDTFYSCLLCQSFAPNHVCIITPERLGLCGAYNWLDGKAAHEIDETGPNQPVAKGRCLDSTRGIWEGVNEYVYKNSHKATQVFTAYSLMNNPMTSCGCFEVIVAYVPECNGVMAVNREFLGDTPVGMTFSTLAGIVGGGVQTPGFMGVGKAFLSSRKFLSADGGIRRVIWMPKQLKEMIAEDFRARAEKEEAPDLWDRIADESVATDPHAIREFMARVDHPVLAMAPMDRLWTDAPVPTGEVEQVGPVGQVGQITGSQGDTSAKVEMPRTVAIPPKKKPAELRALEIPAPDLPLAKEALEKDAAKIASGNGDPVALMSALFQSLTTAVAGQLKEALKSEIRAELKEALVEELRTSLLAELKVYAPPDLKQTVVREVAGSILGVLQRTLGLPMAVPSSLVLPEVTSARKPEPEIALASTDLAEARPEPTPQAPAVDRKLEVQETKAKSADLPRAPIRVLPKARRYAQEKIAEITRFALVKEPGSERVEQVTIGATSAEGGTRGKTVAVGGQNCLPFHYFEGEIPHTPAFALEVFDRIDPKISPALAEAWGGFLGRPVEMAREAVERYGAELISVRLDGTHPDKGNKSPEEAAALVKDVLAAVDVPVIVTAHSHFETANEVMKKVAAVCKGERLLLNWVEGDNYRTIAGLALAYGHCLVAQSPIDVNLAKQLNILLTNMDIPRDRIVMDALTGALGYGLEYTFSVMERIRLTALGGDRALAFPMLVAAGQEASKVKEARACETEFPAWGNRAKRAVLWEVQTAMPLVLAGADLVVLHHPESLGILRRNVEKLSAYRRPESQET